MGVSAPVPPNSSGTVLVDEGRALIFRKHSELFGGPTSACGDAGDATRVQAS
jgi:hypothetical protein